MKPAVLFVVAASALLVGCSGKIPYAVDVAVQKVSGIAEGLKEGFRHSRPTEPVCVRVVTAAYSESVAATVLVGTVEPSKNSTVSALYGGTLKKIYVRKGQAVKAGTVIAEIDAQSVKSAYAAAKAVCNQAEDAMQRVEKVYATGSVPEVKMVEARTALAKAMAALSFASRALDDCRVKAPYSGVVGEVCLHEGMEISAMSPIIQLLDISSVEVHAAVPENEYAAYDVGMKVRIEVPAAGRTLDGFLAVKGIDALKLTRSYDCTFKIADVSDARGIMPGMVCKVHMTGACRNAIVIPASAVMIDGEGRYVWCCNGGVVIKKHIVSGGFSGKGVIVSGGLEPGDMVVVDGSRKISDGMSGINVIESESGLK